MKNEWPGPVAEPATLPWNRRATAGLAAVRASDRTRIAMVAALNIFSASRRSWTLGVVEFACALPILLLREDRRGRDPYERSRRRRSPASRVRFVRAALHHLRAGRGAADRRREARRLARALRPAEASARAVSGGRRQAGQRRAAGSPRGLDRRIPPRPRPGGGRGGDRRAVGAGPRGFGPS